MNQIKCSTCLCESVCKYKDMGIAEALKDFELNSQLQKFSSCLQIDVSCKNYVAKGGRVYENLSQNSEERRQNTFFAIVYGMIDGYLERKDNFSTEEIKWLKSTHMSLFEYIQALGKRVGQDELMRIYRGARDNRAELKPRTYEGQLIVDKDALEEICRMAVETHCFGCEIEHWQDCELYKFMDKCGMGNIEEQQGKCTYWYPKE